MTKEEDAPRNDVEGDKPSQRRKKKIKNVTIMRKNSSFNHFVMLATAAVAMLMASCIHDEVVLIPDPIDDSRNIGFSANVVDDEAATRGGASRRTLSDGVIANADGDLSLPLVVTQEQGIRTSAPVADTRGAKVTKDDVYRMRVWATYHKDGATELGFNDENHDGSQGLDFVRQEGSSVFHSDPQYMWPGNGTFDFVSVGNLPADIDTTISDTNPGAGAFYATLNDAGTAPVKFTYRVPDVAERQSDIIIAKATEIQGDTNASVSLDFKHIMAAVNFKVGDVVAGTIKSISLTGVYNKGEYLLSDNEWVNRYIEDGGVFNANIGGDRVVVEDDALNGTQLNSDGATFMMIPQSLYTGAELVVEFVHATNNKPYTLRASIQGGNWAMGTTTNYMINIDHNYELQIVPLDNVIDSHYVIAKVEISSESPNWMLFVQATDHADVSVELESKLNPMAKQGFWTDKQSIKSGNEYVATNTSVRGDTSVSSSEDGLGAITNEVVCVFIPENISGTERKITLTLMDTSTGKSKSHTFTQHSIKWLDPTGAGNPDNYWGMELLIENGQVPWGFSWDGVSEKYTTTQGNPDMLPQGQLNKIISAMGNAGIDYENFPEYVFLGQKKYNNNKVPGPEGEYLGGVVLMINYEKLATAIDMGESESDGHSNTMGMYRFGSTEGGATVGIELIAALKAFVDSLGNVDYQPGSGPVELQSTQNYAALNALKRNKFNLYMDTANSFYLPILEQGDDNWYLPAKQQFDEYICKANWGQKFSWNDYYWTSTIFPNADEPDKDTGMSYMFSGASSLPAKRTENYLTMAIRRKTYSDNVTIHPDDVVVPGAGDNGPEYGEGGNTDNNQGGDIEGNN